jgi:hypothetical protein
MRDRKKSVYISKPLPMAKKEEEVEKEQEKRVKII